MASSEINHRIEILLSKASNQTCADCPSKNPLWASILKPLGDNGYDRSFGVVCCLSCAQHHQFELSERKCRIKSLTVTSEWTPADIKIMERSGNAVVNSMFEATLAAECFEKDVVLNNMNEEDDRRGEFVSRKYIKSEFVNTPFPKARGATVLVNGKDQGSHTGEDAHLASKNSRSIWKRPLNRQSLPARKQSQGNLDVKSVRAHRGKSYSGPVNALKPKNSSSSSSSSSSSKATWNNPTSCRNRMAIQQGKQSTNKASSHTSSPPQLGRRLSFSTSRLLQTSQIQSAVSRISTFSVVGKRQSRHAASTIRSVTSSSKERPDVRGSSRSSWNSQRAVLASF